MNHGPSSPGEHRIGQQSRRVCAVGSEESVEMEANLSETGRKSMEVAFHMPLPTLIETKNAFDRQSGKHKALQVCLSILPLFSAWVIYSNPDTDFKLLMIPPFCIQPQ